VVQKCSQAWHHAKHKLHKARNLASETVYQHLVAVHPVPSLSWSWRNLFAHCDVHPQSLDRQAPDCTSTRILDHWNTLLPSSASLL